MPYRYKLWIETGFVGDDAYDEFIETEEPLTEDELQNLALEHFNNQCSYGGFRVDKNDNIIDIDEEEEESEEE